MTPLPLNPYAAMPFHFWTVVFFVFGSVVGSFLNVCIHRLPRGESVVSPPSHCPHCRYSIPWFLNIPLITWLVLRGRCANCRAPIAFRYFLVELLTALAFVLCWLVFGPRSPALAVVGCLLLAGFIAATFIDFEHFIIPDEITLGGIAAGILCSFLVPQLHGSVQAAPAMLSSFIGAAFGWGLMFGILRLAKLAFGRQRFALAPGSTIHFAEMGLQLPDRLIPYDDLFYRKSDTIVVHAERVELSDRCYGRAQIRLNPQQLKIDDEAFAPESVGYLSAVTSEVIVPREAMGFGDVKFMAAIGAFIGWQGVVFSLMVSSLIGSVVGLSLIAMGRQAWSSCIPYGPYIALAATAWLFGGGTLARRMLGLG
jgi:leader peptidase (prepilin peptidase)/N-methyltransferase